MTSVYVGIGSNLLQPVQQVQHAIQALSGIHETRLIAHSRLYRSVPMGPQDQPDYINAVAALATHLSALDLLDVLHDIESSQGRVRDGSRWGPRSLDLDLLLYGDEIINLPQLQVPHPGLHQRNFVLYPLHEIAPDLMIPGRGELAALLVQCPPTGLEPVDSV
ncbi:MAG: 2-amino-4-hydroxy-6-hydroxymethyldihydropteridine diphosphokinase [Gammaproteobacteria bacterium]